METTLERIARLEAEALAAADTLAERIDHARSIHTLDTAGVEAAWQAVSEQVERVAAAVDLAHMAWVDRLLAEEGEYIQV